MSWQRATTILLFVCGTLLASCERESNPRGGGPPTPAKDLVPPPEQKPEYEFAEGLAQSHPDVVAFMRQFLETCLAGDYGEYRKLVSSRVDPESRGRFGRVLHTMRNLCVETITEVDVDELSSPVYLVSGQADLKLDERTVRRRKAGPQRLSILVLREAGQWRMMLAPREMQPGRESADAEVEPVPTSAPSYPWDKGDDF